MTATPEAGADLSLARLHQAVRRRSWPSTTSTSRSARDSSSRCSAPPAAARPPRCGWSPGSRSPPAARSLLGGAGHHAGCKPYERPVNTVFQNYALFPHLNIVDNVAFGLRRRGVKDVRRQVQDMLDLVELGSYGARRPAAAVRRPAAAGRPGPRPDQRAAGAAARRAARRPRPQAAPADADRAQADPDRGRHHLRPRHPRPGGGHDHGRHRRGDEQGRHRAARARRAELYENPATTFVSNFLGQSNLVSRATCVGPRRRRDRRRRARRARRRSGRTRHGDRGRRCGSASARRRCFLAAARARRAVDGAQPAARRRGQRRQLHRASARSTSSGCRWGQELTVFEQNTGARGGFEPRRHGSSCTGGRRTPSSSTPTRTPHAGDESLRPLAP